MFPGVIGRGYCQSGACQEEQLGEMHGDKFNGKVLFWTLIGIRTGRLYKKLNERKE